MFKYAKEGFCLLSFIKKYKINQLVNKTKQNKRIIKNIFCKGEFKEALRHTIMCICQLNYLRLQDILYALSL